MSKQLLTPNDLLSQGEYSARELSTSSDVPPGSAYQSSLLVDLKDKDYSILSPKASPTDEGVLTFWAKLELDNNPGDYTLNRLSFLISFKADDIGGPSKHTVALTRTPEIYETSSIYPAGVVVITAGNTNIDSLSWLDLIDPLSGPTLGWNRYKLVYGSYSQGTRYSLMRYDGSQWVLMFDILDEISGDANTPGYLLFGGLNQQATSPLVSNVLWHDVNHVAIARFDADHELIASGELVEPFDADWPTRTIHTLLVTGATAEAKSIVTATGDGIYVDTSGIGRQVFRVGKFILQNSRNVYEYSAAYQGSGTFTISYARGYQNLIYEDLKFDIDPAGNIVFRPWWNQAGTTIGNISGWSPGTAWQWVKVVFDQQSADQPIWTVYHSTDGTTWTQVAIHTEVPNWDIESIDLINKSVIINAQWVPTKLATPEKFTNTDTVKIDNTPFNVLGSEAFDDAGNTKIRVYLDGDLSGITLPARLYLTSDSALETGTWVGELHVDPGSYLKDARYRI